MDKFITKSSQETQQVAQDLAVHILQQGPQAQAVVLALSGDLGAGKTTFTQGFAQGLGITEKVLSPTFVVMKKFRVPSSEFRWFYHIDCYRMENEADMKELGLQEIFQNPENIVLVEWPERIKNILPLDVVRIAFTHGSQDEREIVIQ